MKITDVVSHILMIPDVHEGDADSAQDNLVVEIHTDEGIVGIGESDTNPWGAKALIDSPSTHNMGMGLKDILVGQDPLNIEALWDLMYVRTMHFGRRGLGVSTIGALDMALWDLKGKALGQPCWMLLGGARQSSIPPYASLQPQGGELQTYTDSLVDWVQTAKDFGFKAVKLEVTLTGPYAHGGLDAPEEKTVDVVEAVRAAAGPDLMILVDVQYAFQNARQALRTLKHLEPLDLYFVETPLSIDDLDGYAYLHDNLDIRIAAGEWQTGRFEFIDLMDRGKVDVAQPDVGRVGGLTEARRVCHLAEDRGRIIVPHCWKTGIGIAASVHMAVNTSNCALVEFLPSELCHSIMRKELVTDELRMENGVIPAPTKPGLGIELNRAVLERLKVG